MRYFLLLLLLSTEVLAVPQTKASCELVLQKSHLTKLEGELAAEVRSALLPYKKVEATIEWTKPGRSGHQMILLQPNSEGNFTLPPLDIEYPSDGRFSVVVSAWKEIAGDIQKMKQMANIFRIEPISATDPGMVMTFSEALDFDFKPELSLVGMALALTAVPSVQEFKLLVEITRDELLDLDLSDPEDIDVLLELERSDVGEFTAEKNIKLKKIFDRILELKRIGLDDYQILNFVDMGQLRFVPGELGPWKINDISITTFNRDLTGPAKLFENGDRIYIEFDYTKPPDLLAD